MLDVPALALPLGVPPPLLHRQQFLFTHRPHHCSKRQPVSYLLDVTQAAQVRTQLFHYPYPGVMYRCCKGWKIMTPYGTTVLVSA